MDVPRHDAHLAPEGVDDTRAVGAYEAGLRLALQRIDDLIPSVFIKHVRYLEEGSSVITTHANFVKLGDTLGDADDEANLVLDSLDDSVCGARRRDVENSRVRLCFPHSLNTTFFGRGCSIPRTRYGNNGESPFRTAAA